MLRLKSLSRLADNVFRDLNMETMPVVFSPIRHNSQRTENALNAVGDGGYEGDNVFKVCNCEDGKKLAKIVREMEKEK